MLFEKEYETIQSMIRDIQNHVVGQQSLIENLVICLLANGHALIEGAPGLAKTTTAKLLASSISADFHRIQFTPDLLPSDLIGSDIFVQADSSFSFRKGPIFQNILLADEINRAPAKVQSALLEAMEERQVTVGNHTYKLDPIFMVLATQNPIEQEGTYTLPEAQMDRFFMKINVEYPSPEDELSILNLHETKKISEPLTTLVEQSVILSARTLIDSIYLDEKLKEYIVSLVQATRNPQLYSDQLKGLIQFGASPRASISLMQAAKIHAWMEKRDYVSPENIQAVAPYVIQHRISPSFEAEADDISNKEIVESIIKYVAIP